MNKNLSFTENLCWNTLNDNIDVIPSLSITKASFLCNCSTATIVRTLKKKGFTGYIDFKNKINKVKNPFSNLDSLTSNQKNIILKNINEVRNTLEMLNVDIMSRCIDEIFTYKSIFIFARGFSELLAKEMTTKLQLLNKNVQLITDPDIIEKISNKVSKGQLVIFISLNGKTKELVYASNILKEHKIKTICITTNQNSILAQNSTIKLIGYKSKMTSFPDFEVHSRLPLDVLVRCILDLYVSKYS